MRPIFLRILKVFLIAYSFNAHGFVPGLLEHGREMVGLIEEARTCSVNLKGSSGELSFCTGLTLGKEDLKFLRGLTLKTCQQFLVQMGHKVYKLDGLIESEKLLNSGLLQEDVVKDFFNSTKLAWILHREKIILFKPEARRGDCMHEVIHFYQRQRPRKSDLAPLSRKSAERRLQFLLEKAVNKVEEVEKKGNKKKAQEMAAQLQPFISLQKEWQKLLHWLDEKEIYQAFFDFSYLFKVSERDRDIALANLVRLKESLPWDLKERVLFEAQEALNKKYSKIKTPRGLSGFKSEQEYGVLYNKGKISRDVFEEKVIAMRKYKAWEKVKDARRKGNLLEILKGLGLAREFKKHLKYSDLNKDKNKKFIFKYKTYKELPSIVVEGETFIIDSGANDSVMPPKLLEGLKENEVRLLGLKRLQTIKGTTDQAPLIQVSKKLNVAGNKISGLTFTVSELGIPGISGILGMDFFRFLNSGRWQWRFKDGSIGPLNSTDYNKTFFLQSNGRGIIDALEFVCKDKGKNKVKIRFDSGSQVWGDRPSGKEGIKLNSCLPGSSEGKFLDAPKLSALFSREVDVNIGHAYMKTLQSMAFDLQKRELYLNHILKRGGGSE